MTTQSYLSRPKWGLLVLSALLSFGASSAYAVPSAGDVAAQNLQQLLNGSVLSHVNDMNAQMQSFVLSQGQRALLAPMDQHLQVRWDGGLFLGNSNHKANVQQISVVANLGGLRARAAVSREANRYRFGANELFQGHPTAAQAGISLDTTSRIYGFDGGLAYTLESLGVTLGAQLAYQQVRNEIAQDQLAKILPSAQKDLSFKQSVMDVDLIASKFFDLNLLGLAQVRIAPFAGYRYGFEHQNKWEQKFLLKLGQAAQQADVDLSLSELSRHRNSLLVGVQTRFQKLLGIQGLSVGAAVNAQLRFDDKKSTDAFIKLSEQAVNNLGVVVGKVTKPSQASLEYQDESRFSLQAHLDASYQLESFTIGVSLDALSHQNSSDPVLIQVGAHAALNF